MFKSTKSKREIQGQEKCKRYRASNQWRISWEILRGNSESQRPNWEASSINASVPFGRIYTDCRWNFLGVWNSGRVANIFALLHYIHVGRYGKHSYFMLVFLFSFFYKTKESIYFSLQYISKSYKLSQLYFYSYYRLYHRYRSMKLMKRFLLYKVIAGKMKVPTREILQRMNVRYTKHSVFSTKYETFECRGKSPPPISPLPMCLDKAVFPHFILRVLA